jgi:hypothetical protein
MRYLSDCELREIARYLNGTKAHLRRALSELGFDPDEYPAMRQWLSQVRLIQSKTTHRWNIKE